MSMTTLISKLLHLFVTSDKGQVHQVDISSSLGELAPSSSSASSLSKSLSSSLDAVGEGEEATMKPPMVAYHRVIWPTRVFTWHNSSLRVSRWASMRTSCAMMASSVIPPIEDEGAEVEGAVEVRGAAVSIRGCLNRSWASLHLTVALSMAPMTEKWGNARKEIEKWWRIRVIAEGKINISRVAIFL